MQHYVGLDVSVKETSVCIVDKAGRVIREVNVATESGCTTNISERQFPTATPAGFGVASQFWSSP
jgi:transposase